MAACRMEASNPEDRASEHSSGHESYAEFNRSVVCSPAMTVKEKRPVGGDSAPQLRTAPARRRVIQVDRRWLAVANQWADSCPVRTSEAIELAIRRQELTDQLLKAVNRAFSRLLDAKTAAGFPPFEESLP
ncbi:hypothetical protein M3Y99_00991800 [Aphelenchoides fujianensis]|nr:hypothetical protein M3Y99_00991800 [Aphelenchoides fujianensis]